MQEYPQGTGECFEERNATGWRTELVPEKRGGALIVCIDPEGQSRIHRLSERSMPVGNDRFRARIEELTGIRLGQAKRGRPKKQTTGDGSASEGTAATG